MSSITEKNEKKVRLFRRDFTMVVIGQIISLFGNAILRFALPLYLLKVTGSAALFGMVTAVSFLPVIVLSLLGGVLADRVNKRNIMVVLDFLTAGLMFSFCLLLHNVPVVALLLAVLMLLYGIQGIYQPAVQASIPAIVAQEKLLEGNAVINQVNSLAGLLGPVLGGVLYSVFGLVPVVSLSVICFLVSAVMEIFIRIPHIQRKTDKKALELVRADLMESFGFMKKERPELLQGSVVVALFNLFLSAVLIIGLPVLMVENLQINDKLYGISQGVMAFGGLAGGALAGIIGRRIGIDKAQIWLFLCALSVLPMGLVTLLGLPVMVSYVVITFMSFVCMACSTLFVIQVFSYVQQNTPQELVGKVMSVIMVIAMCAQPVGQAMYGLLFDRFAQSPGGVLLFATVTGSLVAAGSARIFRRMKPEEDLKREACIPVQDSVQ